MRVNSGTPTIEAAYEVTGAELTNYFIETFHETTGWSNGSDWWDRPTKTVDMCIFSGDLTPETPGPSGASEGSGSTSVRVLVVISSGDAELWASGVDDSALPAVDPATIAVQCREQDWPPPQLGTSVDGISVTTIDEANFEITNATDRTYYFKISYWPTATLPCGQGRNQDEVEEGPVHPHKVVQSGPSSTADVPVTVEIRGQPCGEGCDTPPLATYLVPVSQVVPTPIST